MDKAGPIVIIEDDEEDQYIFAKAFRQLGYTSELIFFDDGMEALTYLKKLETKPFMVLSDINMPKLNGFELRKQVFEDETLKLKCVPYLFFTTAANKKAVTEAYSLSVQGIFVKPDTVELLQETVRRIVEYWTFCISPA